MIRLFSIVYSLEKSTTNNAVNRLIENSHTVGLAACGARELAGAAVEAVVEAEVGPVAEEAGAVLGAEAPGLGTLVRVNLKHTERITELTLGWDPNLDTIMKVVQLASLSL